MKERRDHEGDETVPSHPIHQVWMSKVPIKRSWWSIFRCCIMQEVEGKKEDVQLARAIESIKVNAPKYDGEPILPPPHPHHVGRKTLVIDLDETLVHSSFTPVASPDYVIPVEIDRKVLNVYVRKRPWVDHFLEAVSETFEVVVFTASLTKYANPLLDKMDRLRVIHHRLFRESCVYHEGNFVKDLSRLGRCLKNLVIIDNSPHSYIFQPENAIPIGTFIDDPSDRELLDVLPYVMSLHQVDDVRTALGMAFENLLTEGAARTS